MVLYQKLWYKNSKKKFFGKGVYRNVFKLVSVVMDVVKNNSNKSGMRTLMFLF